MNNVDALDTLLGVAIPIIVGFVTKRSWPGSLKGLLMIVISLIVAGVKVALSGQLDLNGEHLAATFFVIAVSGEVSYRAITKEWAQQLQNTGPIKDTPPAPKPNFSELNDF